jgi:hypothetical protein
VIPLTVAKGTAKKPRKQISPPSELGFRNPKPLMPAL